ncbi:cation:proton antiporter [Krasilnikoviella flava]|uniref:Monovalent cation:H+ antiporter, CPA1 family n=1 Tax=Krasilnikoviella flava TaxID=526729 RepID=A0A1T5K1M0_9MICO|nr:sodium:proton antiporter [Krasilnikoviella flava]SKC57541.1 monovalent cation:H+ antiporter, CPA1 family [Krasilnikoviella flava]
MEVLLVAVLAAVVVIAVTALAPRAGVAAPLVLVLIGVAVSFVPAVAAIDINPEVILVGVLPALLYASAASFPSMDFRRDFTAIGGMAVLLVVISAVLLGFVFSWVIPGIDLAAGIALGAIVSPTDAVATSIIKKLGAPQRVVVMLEGEGLLNDATSLVLLRSAIAATAASVSLWGVVGSFFKAVLLAVIIGVIVGRLGLWAREHLRHAALSTAVSFVVPFVAYLPAEELDASGIVAAVAAGLVTSTLSARHLSPQDRVAERMNWRTIEILLEGGLFLAMGLEVFGLVQDVREAHGSLWTAVGVAALAAAGVIALRAMFVLPLLRYLAARRRRAEQVRETLDRMEHRVSAKLDEFTDPNGIITPEAAQALSAVWTQGDQRVWEAGNPRRQVRRVQRRVQVEADKRRVAAGGLSDDQKERIRQRRMDRITEFRRRFTRRIADVDYLVAAPLGPKEGVVIVWAGMRGVVTLAAAQTLPHDFPQRSLLILIAFGVAAGTLLVQGGTLPWVVRRLGLAGVTSSRFVEGTQGLREIVDGTARDVLDDPELRRKDGTPYAPYVVDRVRSVVVREQADQDEEEATPEELSAQFFELRLATIAAQRKALLEARALGTYDSDLLSRALEQLDADQIAVEMRGHLDGG